MLSSFGATELQEWVFHCGRLVRLSEYRVRGVHPRQRLEWEAGPYVLKTASTWEDLKRLLQLRHDVFHAEHHGRYLPMGLDIDPIDFVCDHLGLFCRETGEAVGSYRVTDSAHSDQFYAKKRFHLDALLRLPGRKLELGRACIHREHRNGATIAWLWRGLSRYAEAVGADYLFGSASIRTADRNASEALFARLEREGHVRSPFLFTPREECALETMQRSVDSDAAVPLPLTLPSLFEAYLRAGAKVAGRPAVDPFLGSVDYPIVLRVDALQERFSRRYRRA